MAGRGKTTFAKRQKELARQERRRAKLARRVERKELKQARSGESVPNGIDPDIAGIRPGPQPLPWDLVEEDQAPEEEDE
ncbi:MAG TPA: hypothetical protein VGB99_05755 [Acidobacteriota bacterium]